MPRDTVLAILVIFPGFSLFSSILFIESHCVRSVGNTVEPISEGQYNEGDVIHLSG